MERSMPRKSKPVQIRYPAPYSHSWAGAGFVKKPEGKKKTCSKCMSVMRSTEPANYYHRPDPTVPHLKYGLFPKKPNRNITRILSPKKTNPRIKARSPESLETVPMMITDNMIREMINIPRKVKRPIPSSYRFEPIRVRPQKNAPHAPSDDSEEPVLVFHPIDRKDFRRLTVSASTHLDIKPRP